MLVNLWYRLLVEKPANIYLDHHATTPLDPRVRESMLPYWSEKFGNPASHQHSYGWEAKAALELARKQVAELVGALPREIIFTSSVTENFNWLGFDLRERIIAGESVHVITSSVEHSAAREVFARLQNWGADITWLPVDQNGCVSPADVRANLRPSTQLVSLIYGHNEVGSLNPVQEIAEITRDAGVLLHLDCSQALSTVEADVNKLPADLVSISGHKIYGPKGAAALYMRSRPTRVRLKPMIVGGSQESGLRAGTVALPLVVGLGQACALAKLERTELAGKLLNLRAQFLAELKPLDVRVNGLSPERLPQSMSVTFPVTYDQIFPFLPGVAVSSGSACGPNEGPNPVLLKMGFTEKEALSTLRFCLGRFTTEKDVQTVTAMLKRAIK